MIWQAPKSSVAGLSWPGLPEQPGRIVLALLYQLEASQWWPPEVLRRHQFAQLELLVRHAAKSCPYYRAILRRAGVSGTAALTPERWSRIPLLRRRDVQRNFESMLSRQVPKSHGWTRKNTTSGSTGMPVEFLTTELMGQIWRAFTLREHLWQRRNFGHTLASIRHMPAGQADYPNGARLPDWGPSVAMVYATGPAALLDINTPVDKQAEWLARQGAGYLVTYSSNLEALAKYCLGAAIEISGLEQVNTQAEVLSPATRRACREAWGIEVADTYSAQEVGYMALQCPAHEHYHVQEGVLVEILDDAGVACGVGEIGRVVATPLHNFAMPLIRYEIGDYAEVGAPCDCGRGLLVLKRILGRVRNMLTLPSGQRVWPSIRDPRYNEIAPIEQFQFVQHSLRRIEARIVARRPVTDGEEERLRAVILERLGYPFELVFTYLGEIPRSAGGKYEDFISKIDS